MKTRRGLFGTFTQMVLGALMAPVLANSTQAPVSIQVLKDGAGGFIFTRNGRVFKHLKTETVAPQVQRVRRIYHIDVGNMSPDEAQQHIAAIKADLASPERHLFESV